MLWNNSIDFLLPKFCAIHLRSITITDISERVTMVHIMMLLGHDRACL